MSIFGVDFPADTMGTEVGKVGLVANQIEEKTEKTIVQEAF